MEHPDQMIALWILLACMLASPVGRHIASADVIAK
jgi:hypothetical protein